MSLLKKVTPINLLEEKVKFFDDETYNPQFIYEAPVPKELIYKYGLPKNNFLDLAQAIIDQTYSQRTEEDLDKLKGDSINQSEVTQKTKDFLDLHQLEKRYKIVWSNSFVARATITSDTIKLKHPADFRQLDLLSMLYHEVGTHALRRINYEQQPWYKNKATHGFKNYLRTEEGLAGLHSLYPLKFQQAYYPALNYLSVNYAQEHSFVELWNFLKKYISNPERRWERTFRRKRGLTDTSQPGGYTKDLVYFEGIVETWNYLKQHDFDISKLYIGKIAWQDVDKAVQMNPDFIPLLPSFYLVDPQLYAEKLAKIGSINNF